MKACLIEDILFNLGYICITKKSTQGTIPAVITIRSLNLKDKINKCIYSRQKRPLNNSIYQFKYEKLKKKRLEYRIDGENMILK